MKNTHKVKTIHTQAEEEAADSASTNHHVSISTETSDLFFDIASGDSSKHEGIEKYLNTAKTFN